MPRVAVSGLSAAWENKMSEAALLRILADKLDDLETITTYPASVTEPGAVTVSWEEQADHAGYAALSEAISTLVGQHWNALRAQVVKQRETEVQAARQDLANGASAVAAEKSSAISSSVEAALRKAVG
jgi:hypothetical protein